MQKNTPNIKHIIDSLMNGPSIKPTGPFWKGYTHILNGDIQKCKELLSREYLDSDGFPKKSERREMIAGLSCGLPAKPTDSGWVELLAAAGQTIILADLYQAGRVDPIHAINAEIEMRSDSIPNPRFRPDHHEMNGLLEFYDVESEILSHCLDGDDNLTQWLTRRRFRAVEYFETIEFCQDMEAAGRLEDERIEAELAV